MTTNILQLLMSKGAVSTDEVQDASNNLSQETTVTLEGVNAPEFAEKAFVPFDMEEAFATQSVSKPIPLPTHDDGLDDVEEDLTSAHVGYGAEPVVAEPVVAEPVVAEPVVADASVSYRAQKLASADMSEICVYSDDQPWFKQPWNSRLMNLSTRTRNALHKSHLRDYADLRYISLEALEKLKGVGKRVVTELQEVGEDLRSSDDTEMTIGALSGDNSWTREFQDFQDHSARWEESADSVSSDASEPSEWNLKPFSSSLFGFGGRTSNSLDRAGYTCFDDIKGMSISELSAIKGFGAKCLDEVMHYLENEIGMQGWIVAAEPVAAEPVVAEPVIAEPVIAEPVVAEPVVAEPVVAEPVIAEPVVAEPVVAEPVVAEPVVAEPVVAEPVVAEDPALQIAPFKILVIGGGAALMRQGMSVASFEQVYTEAIQMICNQASAASLASVDYGKGWSALGATIRGNGWPANVDVLTVSKSYMGRPEILMELRLLADLVVEA